MVVTEVSICKRNKNRVNVYTDGEFAFACYNETAVKNGLKKGAHISAAMAGEIAAEDGRLYAFNVALKYVASKMRTQKEIENKLKEKKIEAGVIADTLGKLEEYGYIDGEEYARIYAAELSAKYGEKMVINKLVERGIDRGLAAELAARLRNTDVLREQALMLERRYSGDEPRKRKQKMIRTLMARGFSYDDIRGCIGGGHEE